MREQMIDTQHIFCNSQIVFFDSSSTHIHTHIHTSKHKHADKKTTGRKYTYTPAQPLVSISNKGHLCDEHSIHTIESKLKTRIKTLLQKKKEIHSFH